MGLGARMLLNPNKEQKGKTMSRLKNPPKEICMIRTVQGEWTNTDANPKTLEELGLRVAIYDLRPETERKTDRPARTRKKAEKAPETQQDEETPVDMPSETDNATSEATEANLPIPTIESKRKTRKAKTKGEKPMFKCSACKKTVDNPKTAGNGQSQCPNCLRVGTIVAND